MLRNRTNGVNSTIANPIWYYVFTIGASCVSAGFLMTIEFQGKVSLFFVLIISFLMGSFASFVFALVLRRTAHLFGRNKWWVWLLGGAILAPVLILFAGMCGGALARSQLPEDILRILSFLFYAPMVLAKRWWLSLPIGIITSLVAYAVDNAAAGESVPSPR
jgi:hypothetical protein